VLSDKKANKKSQSSLALEKLFLSQLLGGGMEAWSLLGASK
jgi:hypothetical protein